jgi:hypothetical protein
MSQLYKTIKSGGDYVTPDFWFAAALIVKGLPMLSVSLSGNKCYNFHFKDCPDIYITFADYIDVKLSVDASLYAETCIKLRDQLHQEADRKIGL